LKFEKINLPWADSGGLFFVDYQASSEHVSVEKPLLQFLSNLSHSFTRL
jgi:hypothetical protein